MLRQSKRNKRKRGGAAAIHRGGKSKRHWYYFLIGVALIVWGGSQANLLRWFCDDIFITLRYVENFLEGKGIVYNQGEFVEGYTHFLWMIMLTGAQWVGFDPLASSLNLGVLSYLGVLVVFLVISYRLNINRLPVVVPFTALALALHYDFRVWATGGLETMFYTFLWSLAFYLYFFTDVRMNLRLLVTGFILILAVFTRPDGALIFFLANISLFAGSLIRHRGWRAFLLKALLLNAGFIVLYVPYLIWKLSYYGDILPNSYYAKSGGISYYEMGLYYLWLYFKPYFTSCLFLLGVPVALKAYSCQSKEVGGKRWDAIGNVLMDRRSSSLIFAFCAVVVYAILFIARVGGDFMYARFVVPAIPFILFIIEMSVIELTVKRRWIPVVVFVILAFLVGTVEKTNRDRLLIRQEGGQIKTVSRRGVIDERAYYTYESTIRLERAFGQQMEPYFRGLDMTVLLKGQACLGYYAKFKTCIEMYGLTDSYIAHLSLESRSRVGHEKQAPYDYMIERGVDFVFGKKVINPPIFSRATFLPPGLIVDEIRGIMLEKVDAEVVTYDRELFKALADRLGGRFVYTDFERMLDEYIAGDMQKESASQLLDRYRLAEQYYFLHNEDAERERIFLDAIEGAGLPAPR